MVPTIKSNMGIFIATFMTYTLYFNKLNINLGKKIEIIHD